MTSDEGSDAAAARVAALFEDAARVNLGVVVVAPPDATRESARDAATSAAIVAGRNGLLREATAAAREIVLKGFASAGFSGTWAATEMSASVARATDRVAAAAALEEATIAAVAEDLIDEYTFDTLNATWADLVSGSAIPTPGSLASVASPAAGVIRGPIQIAIVVAIVLTCAAVGFAFWSIAGLVIVFAGVGILGAVAQRLSRPVP
jgi:hypothetical protein